MVSDVSLVFALLAKDAASAVIDKVGGKLSGVGKVMVAAGTAIAGAAFAGGKALLDLGAEFDDAYDRIRVTTGKTGEALASLKDDFRAVVADVPTDFASASTAIAELNQRTGATGPVLQDLAARMLELSRLTGTDLSANIAGMTRIFGDWNISTDKQSGALDAIFRASQATGASVTSLAEKVVQFGAPLRQLGFSFEESIAMLGKFEKEGVNTEIVLGAMRKGLAKFAKAGEDPAKALQTVIDKIKGAGSAAEGNKVALEVFGAKAGPDMAAAIREGRFELGSLFQTVSSGSETIMTASEDTQDFAEKWQIFKNNVLLKLEPIAERVFTALGDVGKRLIPAFQEVSVFVTTRFIPAVRELVAWFVEKFGPAASEVATLVKNLAVGAFGLLVGVIKTITPALQAIGSFLIDKVVPAFTSLVHWINENGKTIVIVAGIIAAVFIPHWIALGVVATVNAAKAVIAFIVMKTEAIISAAIHSAQILIIIGGWIMMGTVALANAARMAIAWLIAMGPIAIIVAAIIALVVLIILNWDTIRNKTVEIWNAIWKAVSDLITKIADWIGDRVRWIVGAWNFLGDLPKKIAGWLGDVLDSVGRKLGEVVQFFRDLPGKILDGLGNLGELLVNAGKDIIMGLLRGIGDFAHKIWEKIKEIAKAAWDAVVDFFSIFSPSHRMQWAGEMIGRGLVRGLDRMSGPVSDAADRLAHSAMVTVPLPAMATLGGSSGASRAGGATAPAVHVHFSGPVGSPRELENWLVRALDDLGRHGRG